MAAVGSGWARIVQVQHRSSPPAGAHKIVNRR
jgi:hypothetical protein